MKQLFIFLYCIGITLHISAQSITYNHDESVMQQFLVGETGAGRFTPDLYYDTFHKSYRNSAMAESKNVFRNDILLTLIQETPHAEDIDSSLVSRAEVEALNVADRTPNITDAAWLVEGNKVEGELQELLSHINQIIPKGGSTSLKEVYTSKYNCLTTGLEAVREAYMPMSQRKMQYLSIYKNTKEVLSDLQDVLVYLESLANIRKMQVAHRQDRQKTRDIASEAKGRWRIAMSKGSGNN